LDISPFAYANVDTLSRHYMLKVGEEQTGSRGLLIQNVLLVGQLGRAQRLNGGESPRLWQARSRASTNTHTGVFYVRTVHGREQGHSLCRHAVKMRM
jgi:hypothetical protein